MEEGSNALVLQLRDLERRGALSATHLDLRGLGMSFAEYEQLGQALARLGSASRWWLGDWILWGEERFGEEQAQALTSLRISEERLLDYVRVARLVPPERRRAEVPWSCHRLVATLPEEEQVRWLGLAEEEGWSFRELQEAMRREALAQRREAEVEAEELPWEEDDDDQAVEGESVEALVEEEDYGECLLCRRPFASAEERDRYYERLRRRTSAAL